MSFQNQDQPDKHICIGKIAGAHGVKGLVKILPFGDDVKLIESVQDFKITIKSSAGQHLLAHIEGITDRDAAQALKGTELFVSRDVLPPVDEGEFYYEDLTGLKTVDEDGKENGQVMSVQNYGAGDLLEVRLKSGHEILIPFTDDFVPDVGDTVTIRQYEDFIL